MGCLRAVIFHGFCRDLWGISQMDLINVLIYVVLKILYNFVFVEKSLFADISKISESVEADITFVLNLLLETANVFAWIYYVLQIKNVVNFIKKCFSWKRGCITMCNYVETFQCNSADNVIYNIFTQMRQCKN